MRPQVLLPLIALLFPILALGQTNHLYINEILSENVFGLSDEFGEPSDWLELYNSGNSPIDLAGYSLTDDPDSLQKWTFPAITISPDQYLVVFASGRDIFSPPVIWETVVDWGDEWRYLVPEQNTASNWRETGFNDTNWQNGNSGFGYGDNDDFTQVPSGTQSIFLRKEIQIDQIDQLTRAILHIDYDDGFAAYLNGVEIARANLGSPGSQIAFDKSSDSDHEAKMYGGSNPDQFEIQDISQLFVPGKNVLAIEIHNASESSSDMTVIPFLSLGYSSFSGIPYVSPFLQLPSSSLHTNFRLGKGGEFLGLFDANGKVIDSLTFEKSDLDVSYGRDPDNTQNWGFFAQPTPNQKNENIAFDFAKKPEFITLGGFYQGNQQVIINAKNNNDLVYYTFDGTPPTIQSNLYTGPITINKTTAIRARVINPQEVPSKVVTETFFINEPVNLPFISIVTDPDNFFSDERGIYVNGTNGIPGSCDKTVRNLNQDWERPINIEFYEENGTQAINQRAGVKIFGGCSRTRFPQKSLSLFARSQYGKGEFDYQLFPDKPIEAFEAFILRSSGDDQIRSMFGDAFSQYAPLGQMDFDYQAYRPTVVFLNGEYWGIHNMREKINEHYIAGNYGIDPERVNILQGRGGVSVGSDSTYVELLDYLGSHDLSNSHYYQEVNEQMDVNQYMDYMISNIYSAETDWPGNNIKFWNSTDQNHQKWRWIMFDRDGSYRTYRIETDALALATEAGRTSWPNPDWATFILRKMLTTDEFKNPFIQIFAYHINTTFEPTRMNQILNQFSSRIAPEIPRHITKWGGAQVLDTDESWTPGPTFDSFQTWENNVGGFSRFINERPFYARSHLENYFGLEGLSKFTVKQNDENAGIVKLYHKPLSPTGYEGDHFKGIPIELTAFAHNGYTFSHWTVDEAGREKEYKTQTIEIIPDKETNIVAHFEAVPNQVSQIVINEINYNSLPESDPGDWLEIYHTGNQIIDLTGWELKDENDENIFAFPNGFELRPKQYLVICENTNEFHTRFPQVKSRIGNLGFKLSNDGEVIRLYDNQKELVDSVRYGDMNPWVESPDGLGPTLELISPHLDNNLPENWEASTEFGSPGKANNSNDTPFSLYPSYPNPTSFLTTIPYSLNQSANISIRILDKLGRQITSLVNENQEPGDYFLEYEVSHLAGGMYFYSLIVDREIIQTRKMILF